MLHSAVEQYTIQTQFERAPMKFTVTSRQNFWEYLFSTAELTCFPFEMKVKTFFGDQDFQSANWNQPQAAPCTLLGYTLLIKQLESKETRLKV